MDDLKRYLKAKEAVEQQRQYKERLQGGLDQLTSQLKSEFNCASEKEGRKLKAKLEKEIEELEDEFRKLMVEFEEKFGNKIGEG